jgi:hypothetical protein
MAKKLLNINQENKLGRDLKMKLKINPLIKLTTSLDRFR